MDRWPTPVDRRTLRRSEITLLCAMYWPYDQIDNAVEVCRLESAFDTGAHNTNGEDSRGLFQINVAVGAHPGLAAFNLWDAQVNCYFAYTLWKTQGWRPWYNSAKNLGLL